MPDVIINGPEGRIEARYHHSRATDLGDGARAAPASAAWRDHAQQTRLCALSVLRAPRLFHSALQLSRRGTQPGQLRPRRRRIVRRRLGARLATDLQPQCWNLLGRRLFLRGLDRYAAVDATARDRELHRDRSACEHLRLYFSRPVPVIGSDPARRPGHGGADRTRCKSSSPSCRTNATSRSIFARSPAPTIISPTASTRSPATSTATSVTMFAAPTEFQLPPQDAVRADRKARSLNRQTGRAPAPCPRARGWSRASRPGRRSALRPGECT